MSKKLPKLDEFIAQSLESILSGISQAQTKFSTIESGVVSPHVGLVSEETLRQAEQTLEFEVNVTASEEGSARGEGGLRVGVVSAGLGGSKSGANSSAATIRFSIRFVPPLIQLQPNSNSPQVLKPTSARS